MVARIVKNDALIEDPWTEVDDDADLPDGPVIVSWQRLQGALQALISRAGPIGVRVPNTVNVADLTPVLVHLALVALEFPKFSDGRAYTQARMLRERYAFEGEIRAVGDVMRDQLFFLRRVGFDAFALRADQNLEQALEAFRDFSITYQPAADQPLPLYRRRNS